MDLNGATREPNWGAMFGAWAAKAQREIAEAWASNSDPGLRGALSAINREPTAVTSNLWSIGRWSRRTVTSTWNERNGRQVRVEVTMAKPDDPNPVPTRMSVTIVEPDGREKTVRIDPVTRRPMLEFRPDGSLLWNLVVFADRASRAAIRVASGRVERLSLGDFTEDWVNPPEWAVEEAIGVRRDESGGIPWDQHAAEDPMTDRSARQRRWNGTETRFAGEPPEGTHYTPEVIRQHLQHVEDRVERQGGRVDPWDAAALRHLKDVARMFPDHVMNFPDGNLKERLSKTSRRYDTEVLNTKPDRDKAEGFARAASGAAQEARAYARAGDAEAAANARDRAIALQEEAIRHQERTGGPEHDVDSLYQGLRMRQTEAGRHKDAHDTAMRRVERMGDGQEHDKLRLLNEATSYALKHGLADEALASSERAQEHARSGKLPGVDHPSMKLRTPPGETPIDPAAFDKAVANCRRAEALAAAGRHDEAARSLTSAVQDVDTTSDAHARHRLREQYEGAMTKMVEGGAGAKVLGPLEEMNKRSGPPQSAFGGWGSESAMNVAETLLNHGLKDEAVQAVDQQGQNKAHTYNTLGRHFKILLGADRLETASQFTSNLTKAAAEREKLRQDQIRRSQPGGEGLRAGEVPLSVEDSKTRFGMAKAFRETVEERIAQAAGPRTPEAPDAPDDDVQPATRDELDRTPRRVRTPHPTEEAETAAPRRRLMGRQYQEPDRDGPELPELEGPTRLALPASSARPTPGGQGL